MADALQWTGSSQDRPSRREPCQQRVIHGFAEQSKMILRLEHDGLADRHRTRRHRDVVDHGIAGIEPKGVCCLMGLAQKAVLLVIPIWGLSRCKLPCRELDRRQVQAERVLVEEGLDDRAARRGSIANDLGIIDQGLSAHALRITGVPALSKGPNVPHCTGTSGFPPDLALDSPEMSACRSRSRIHRDLSFRSVIGRWTKAMRAPMRHWI